MPATSKKCFTVVSGLVIAALACGANALALDFRAAPPNDIIVLSEAGGAVKRGAYGGRAQAAVVPVAVFGTDQRGEVPQRYRALKPGIGYLQIPASHEMCTGFCVAVDIVATSAHCLFLPRKGRLPSLKDITFRIGRDRKYGIAGRTGPFAGHHIAVGTTRFSKNRSEVPEDWALVKLDGPACRFNTLKVAPRSAAEIIEAADRRLVFQLAYHSDTERLDLAYSPPCMVRRDFQQIKWRDIRRHFTDPENVLLHDCDSGPGSSGSPLLLDTPSGPEVVAMHVGTGAFTVGGNRRVPVNTAINAAAFQDVIAAFTGADIITDRDALVRLQTGLEAKGLYTGKIDGIFDDGTRDAIHAFETRSGLPRTGLPSHALLRRLVQD